MSYFGPLDRGKKFTNKKNKRIFFQSIKGLLAGATLSVLLFPKIGLANPTGGQVVGGSATISTPAANTLQINQSTNKAIINWQSYNVGAAERVHYQQPNASSITLNRINGANGASQIFGSITANGRVWLINPAGIWFGPSAHVDVAGLIATTANIRNEDFMNGVYKFYQEAGWNGAIVNEGQIIIRNAGLAAFIGVGVVNKGHIEANLGTVVLGAAQSYTVDFSGDQLINFEVGKNVDKFATDANGNKLDAAVSNTGSIVANGGKVIITAQAAGQVLDKVINMGGVIEAKSVGKVNGVVILGANSGAVRVSGTINVSGKNAGERGGKVKILGGDIALTGKAVIDASGNIGGGEVLIGGNAHGAGPEMNANYVFLGKDVSVKADALVKGNGGKVVVWSDLGTGFYGSITARGGDLGGNGGWVETSGKAYLDVNGSQVNLGAPHGFTGTWLLDPTNIYIATNQANATTAGMSGTDSSANAVTNGTAAASGAVQDSLLTVSTLTTALASANVIVTTTNASGIGVGNITVVDAISWSSTNSLTLTAANNILLNAAVTITNAAANLILNAVGTVTQTAAIGGSGGVIKQGAGTFTMSQANTYSGATLLNAGAITLSGSGTATSTAFTVNQGTTLTLDNSGTNNTNRVSDSNVLTMNGGELVVSGNAGANTSESIGQLALSSGYSTVTISPNAARNTQVTFASLNRTAGATGLFRGTNLGANTVASLTANNSNIVFTSAPTLTGGGGNSGTTTVSIIAGAIGAATNSSAGTDFVTYNPPTGAVNGLRPLLAGEYTATPAANVNLKLTANGSSNANFAINSILLSGGVTYDIDTGGGVSTITVGGANLSGNILSINGTNTIQPTRAGGANFDYATGTANIFAVGNLTYGSLAIVTGTGGLNVSGAGVFLENRSVALSGGLTVNSGTLRSGIASAFSTAQPLTVRAAGTFDLNGNSNSITTLTMESGSTSGASVTTGAGTLTLGGDVTLNVNGSGTTGASISNNLALGATRNFTIADGVATNDLSVSAIISGLTFGITKLGAGQLTLSGTNTYTGVTTINAGTLSVGTINNGGVAGNLGQATNAAANLVLGGGTLQYTGATASTDRNYTLTTATTSSIEVTTAATNLTISGASTATTGALTKIGSGKLILTGANLYTGATAINAGTLSLGVAAALANSAISIASGATLDLNFNSATLGNTSAITLNGTGVGGNGGITFTGNSITMNNAITLNSNSLIGGTGTGTMTLGGAISGAANLTVNLTNAGVSLPAITLTSGGNLAVTTSGSIVQTGAFTVPGTASFTAGANAITLTNASNDFTGAVSFSNSGANNVSVTDANAIVLGASSIGSGSFTVNATGANSITQTGAITQAASAGAASFTTGSGAITLTQSNNFTGAVSLNNSGANNVAITNNAALILGTSTVGSGTLGITANGSISQTGAITQAASAGTVTLTQNAAASDILLNTQANNFSGSIAFGGTVANIRDVGLRNTNAGATLPSFTGLSNLRNLTLQFDNAAIAFPAITLTSGGSLSATAGGAITQSGALVVPGTASFTAGANAITLTNASNDFTGAVSFSNSGANNVSVTDANAIVLGASSIGSGSFTVNATGANSITQTGAITQAASAGAASFTTGSGAITLTQSNNFTGAVSLNNTGANNVAITNNAALILGTSTVGSGTLGITANGSITQTGAITQAASAGTVTLTQNAAASDILLNTQANNFSGSIAFGGTVANIRDVGLRNTNAGATLPSFTGLSNLRNLTIVFNNAAIAFPAITLTSGGSLSATAGGAITQSGALVVPGTASFTAGANAITLTNASNDFTGAVSFSNSGANNVSVTDANAIVLGASSIGSGSFTVNATGANSITQTGAITQAASAGAASFTTGSGAITLTQSNNFTGAVSLNNTGANNVAITNNAALILGTSTVGSGTLGITANGSITQTGAITQAASAGTITLTQNAAASDILLNTQANNFSGSIAFGGTVANIRDVGLRNTNAGATLPSFTGLSNLRNLTLQFDNAAIVFPAITLTSGGNLTATAGGAITQSGALVVPGTASFTAGANAITLTNASNDFTGAVSFSNSGANNVSVTDANAIVLGASSIGSGSFTVNATGANSITQTGAITQAASAGAASFTTGSGAITLTQSNNFTGAVSLNNTGANNVAITNNAALILGTSTVGSGTLGITANGSISQTGAITQAAGAGTITLTQNAAASDILLNTQANNFSGSIAFGGTVANIRDVGLRNTNAGATLPSFTGLSNLRNLTIVFNNAAIAFPAITLTSGGSLSATAGGAITQSGVLTVPGTSSFSAGANAITLTQNNVLTGTVTLSNSGTNDVAINNSIGLSLGTSTVGRKLTATASGTITLAGSLTANATGDSIVLSGTRFDNSGSFSLSPGGSGRYLIWSSNANPFGGGTPDVRGGLVYDFKQYNATYNVTTVLGTGNGFLYTLAPSVTPSLTGTVSKTYDGNTIATLAGSNYSASGAVDGDTINFTSSSASYDNKNVGTGKTVTANGISITSATNGAATVYGYQLSTNTANANVGVITAASLTITPTALQSKVYGTDDTALGFAYTPTGLVSGDSLSGNLGRAAGENVGNYAYNIGSLAPNVPSNYSVTLAPETFAITKASLTITATASQSKVYGTSDAVGGFGYGNTGLVNGVTPKYWDNTGSYVNATIINDTVSGKLGRTAGENVGSYSYNLGSVAVSTPSNYNTSLTADTFAITKASLTINPDAGQNKVYGTNDAIGGFTYGQSGLVTGVTPKYWDNTGTYVDATIINDTISGNLGRAAGENVGNYAFNLGSVAASTPGNYNTSLTAGTFAINKASLTIDPTVGQSKVYGTNDIVSGFTYSNTGLVNGVTPKYWDNTGTYVDASTINDTISGNLGRTAGENVGNYSYNIGSAAVSTPGNYNTSLTAGTFAITKASLSINPGVGQNKVYGTDDAIGGFTFGNTGLVNGVTPKYWDNTGTYVDATIINDTISGKLGRAAGENVASYAFNLGSVAVSAPGNYNTSLTAGTFAITKASLSINPDAGQTKVYGTNDAIGGFTYTTSGLVNGVTPKYWDNTGTYVDASTINDTISGNIGRTAGENVGSYAFNTGNVAPSAPGNYNTSVGGGTFSITKASLAINPTVGQNKVYGTDDAIGGFTFGNTGLVSGVTPKYWDNTGSYVDATIINDTISGNLGRAAGENVGNYAFNLGGVAVSTPGNYNTSLTAGTFAITKASLTINPDAGQTKVYGTDDALGGFTYATSGLVNGVTPKYWDNTGTYVNATTINDTISGNIGRTAGENVGSYAFNTGNVAPSAPGNYNTSVGGGTFSITKASLAINPTVGQNKVYGTDDAIGGFGYGNTGLVNGITPKYWDNTGSYVDATIINDTISGKLGRATGENVGNYAFNLGSVAVSTPGNYNTSLTAGTFAITKASLTINPDAGQTKVYGTDDALGGFTYATSGLVNGVTPKYWDNTGSYVNATTINDTISGNIGRTAGENVGSYAFNTGNVAPSAPGNYNTSVGGGTFSITKTSLSINPTVGQSKVYGTNDIVSGFTYGNTGLINGVTPKYWDNTGTYVDATTINDTISGNLGRAAGENVGNYAFNLGSVAASTPGNYNTSLTAGTFAINKAFLSIDPDAGQTKVYGTNDAIGGFTYTTIGLVSGVTPKYWDNTGSYVDATAINDTISGNIGRTAGENVGSYAFNTGNVAPSVPGNYNTSVGGGTFSITKASLAINPTVGQNKVYGTDDAIGGFTFGNTGLVNGVTPKYWDNTGTYVDATIINDTIAGKLGRAAGENVASYAFNLGSVAVSAPGNYNTSLTAGTFAITKANLTINPDAGQTKVYGTNDAIGGFTYTTNGLVSGITPKYWDNTGSYVNATTISDTISGNIGRAAGENVGTYAFNTGNVAPSAPGNYNTLVGGGTFSITQASLLINPTVGQNKVYGTDDSISGFTFGNTGLVSGVTPKYWDNTGTYVDATIINDTILGNLGRAAGENVGSYAFNLGSVAASTPGNYSTSLTAGTFAITKASLTINPNAGQNKVYGADDSISGFTYTTNGLVSGITPKYWDNTGTYVNATTINDTISGNIGRTAGENVGSYAFNTGNVAPSAPGNYNTSVGGGTFSITKAPLAINPTVGQNKVYGTDDAIGGFTFGNTGLVNGITPKYWDNTGSYVNATIINDTISGKLGRAAGENVGSYAFNIGSVAVSAPSNYNTSLTAGTFAITTASLTINPNAGQSKVYGTDDSISGFSYTTNGLVNGVTPKYWDNTGSYVNATTINDTISGNIGRTAGENVGSYAFNTGNVAPSAPGNYNTSVGGGTFSITKTSLSINPTVGQSKVYGTNDIVSGFTYGNTGLINGVTPKYWDNTGTYVDATTINDTISGNLGRAAGENVGSYAFNLGSVAASTPGNYNTSLTAGTFAINKAFLSIDPDAGQTKVYGTNDAIGGFTYTTIGLVSGVTPKYWDNTGSYVDATAINDTISGNIGRAAGEIVGSYAFNTGNVAPSTPGNYNTSIGGGTFSITKASLAINPTVGQSKVYGTSDSISGFTFGNTGLVSGITPKYWDNTGTYVNATTINDTISGNLGRAAGENVASYAFNLGSVAVSAPGNYNTSLTAGTFAITKASLSINPDAGQTKVYGTNDAIGGFTYTTSGLVSGITPKYWDNTGSYVNATTINDTISGNIGRAAGENVGSYAFNLGSVAASAPGNYNASVGGNTFSITKASLSVNPTVGQSKVYGTDDAIGGFGYGNTGLVSGVTPKYWDNTGTYVNAAMINDTISGNLGRAAGENVGNYSYNIGSVAANVPGNYNTSLTAGTFAITKASLAINPTVGQSKVYGADDPIGGFTFGNTGLVSGVTPKYWNNLGVYVNAATINDSVTGKLGRTAGENVGNYAFNLGGAAASAPGNYNTSLTAGTFAITKASLTLTANSGQNKVYGVNDPVFTYTSSGLKSGVTPKYWNSSGVYVNAATINDNLTGSLSRVINAATENVGNYTINQGSLAVSAPANYNTTYNSALFAITKASLTVTANAKTKVYHSADPALTYSQTGLVNGIVDGIPINDTISGSLVRAPGQNVGVYAINQGTISASSNYILTYNSNTFTITPATLLSSGIVANNKAFDGNKVATLNFSGASLVGVFPGDSVSINTSSYNALFVNMGPADNIPVSVSGLGVTGSSAGNYTLTQPAGLKANITGNTPPPPPIPTPTPDQIAALVPYKTVFPTEFNTSNVVIDEEQDSIYYNASIGNSNGLLNPQQTSRDCVKVTELISICSQ